MEQTSIEILDYALSYALKSFYNADFLIFDEFMAFLEHTKIQEKDAKNYLRQKGLKGQEIDDVFCYINTITRDELISIEKCDYGCHFLLKEFIDVYLKKWKKQI